MDKFTIMDTQWSIVEEDGGFFVHLVIPSNDGIEYDFSLDDAKVLQSNLGYLIRTMELRL